MPKVRNVYTGVVRGNQQVKRQTLGSLTQNASRARPRYYGRYSRHYRTPDIITCRSWMAQGRWIALYCNPSDRQWSVPRRGAITKTAAGHVQNVWRNSFREGTLYDEFEIQLTFQAGNIMPFMGQADRPIETKDQIDSVVANPEVPPGLMDFYEFLELLNQPPLLGAWENEHIIVLHSRVFPRLRLEGFFKIDTPLTFPESADNGNTLTWNHTFHVYRTYPRIYSSTQLQNVYRSWVSTEANDEVLGNRAVVTDAKRITAEELERNAVRNIGTAAEGLFVGTVGGLGPNPHA